jgi:hypothetical protein
MPDASSQLSRHLGPARSGNPAPPFLGSRLFFFSYPWIARSRIRAVRGMAPARTPAPADGGMVPHSESSRPRFGTRPGPCSSPCSPCEPGILSRRVGACRSGPYIQNLTDPNTCAILDSRDWDRTRHAERTGLRILLHRGAGCDPYPIKKKGKTSTGTHLSLHIMSRRLREWQPEEWPGLPALQGSSPARVARSRTGEAGSCPQSCGPACGPAVPSYAHSIRPASTETPTLRPERGRAWILAHPSVYALSGRNSSGANGAVARRFRDRPRLSHTPKLCWVRGLHRCRSSP